MPTFGRTIAGTHQTDFLDADYKGGCWFVLTEDGVVNTITAYIGYNDVDTYCKAVIYDRTGTIPGDRLAISQEVKIDDVVGYGSANAWANFTISPGATLSAGTFYLTLHAEDVVYLSEIIGIVAGSYVSNADAYGDGPSDPFGSFSSGSQTISIYASYSLLGVGGFTITSVSSTPGFIIRTGSNTIELRSDFHDDGDLDSTLYTTLFWTRDTANTEYGPYTASVTKEGSQEYNATYDLDPADGWSIGPYDVKVEISK